eukprot:1151315-Pelagomonas_calceolata.AAC.12
MGTGWNISVALQNLNKSSSVGIKVLRVKGDEHYTLKEGRSKLKAQHYVFDIIRFSRMDNWIRPSAW